MAKSCGRAESAELATPSASGSWIISTGVAYYAQHGKMMPDGGRRRSGNTSDFFGSIGWPATVPSHEALWGSLFKFRREFDQYINLRLVRLMPGVPLANRKPGDIDFFVH